MVDGTIDPRSRGRNSVIGTIHGRPRPPIFGGPGTEHHLSEYLGVLKLLHHIVPRWLHVLVACVARLEIFLAFSDSIVRTKRHLMIRWVMWICPTTPPAQMARWHLKTMNTISILFQTKIYFFWVNGTETTASRNCERASVSSWASKFQLGRSRRPRKDQGDQGRSCSNFGGVCSACMSFCLVHHTRQGFRWLANITACECCNESSSGNIVAMHD